MKKIKQKLNHIAIVSASLLWSIDGILRRSLYALPPAVVVMWEHILGIFVLLPLVLKRKSELKNMTKKEWIAISLVGLFSGALGTIFYTAALGKVQYIQFSVVVLLQQLQPIWAISTAALLLKERLSKRFIFFAAIAIIGSYFVTFKDLKVNMTPGNETLIAALLALSAGVVWAVSTSLSKIVLKKISFILATFLRFVMAAIFALIFIIGFGQTTSITQVSVDQWQALLVIVFSSGLVALLIYYYGLRQVHARTSAILELTWPISAVFIDLFYYKSAMTVTQLIAIVVVLFSMYQIANTKHSAERFMDELDKA